MSILTKICVVIVAFGALGTAVMVTTLATAENNYLAKFNQSEEKVAILQEKLATAQALATDQQNKLTGLRAELASAKASAGQDVTQLKAEIKDLKTKLTQSQAAVTGIRTELAGIKNVAASQKEMIDRLNEEIKKSWIREATLQNVNIATQTKLDEAEATAERLQRTAQNIQEQMVDLKAQLDEKNKQLQNLQAGGGTMQAAAPVVYEVAVPKVTGKINGLQDNIASVDVGTAQGLDKGMKLIIYRGGEFVGYLKLETVRVNSAAGTIVEKEMNPQQGDRVTTRLN